MNFFEKIELINYRNFEKFSLNFSNKCNVIIGPNGSGKTNILESLSLFEKGRGFRKEKLINIINNKNKKNNFIVNSSFITNNSNLDLVIKSESFGDKLKKNFFVNGESSSDSINFFQNLFSINWFLPEMERLFLASPSLRRDFLDRLIYGVEKKYITILNNYKKKIIERSNILKNFNYDQHWISQIENEIVNFAKKIYQMRIKHLSILNAEIKNMEQINKKNHEFKLEIKDDFLSIENIEKSEFIENFLLKLKNSRTQDSITGGCRIGPHKSDIQGYHLTKEIDLSLCSTGQQKTAILLLIIAQCNYLLNSLKRKPILLFDEICSHLDEYNREIFLNLIHSLDVQTFVTGTEKNFFSFLSTKATNYYIN